MDRQGDARYGRAMTGKRILVVHNPTAGQASHRRLEAVVARLRAGGAEVDLRATSRRGDAERFAGEADAGVHDVLAVAGGDGTVNEAVNGLTPAAPPLAILPTGTANVLAWEIGLGTTVARVADTMLHGRAQAVRAGRVDERRFLAMAGVGFDARVVAGVDLALKRHLGKAAYLWQGLKEAWSGDFPMHELEIDGRRERAAAAIIANGRLYAGRYLVAPGARLDDGRLHVCLFRTPGRLAALRYGLSMGLGRLNRLADYEVIPAERVVVSTPTGGPVQGDGDIMAALPARFDVDDVAISLMVPG